MSRPRWHQMIESARAEALNALEFYNRPGGRRPLEAFLVHMHMAWLYMLQAEFLRSGVSYHYKDPKNPRRYLRVDGERKTWDLPTCIKQKWPDEKDPVRQNLELTSRLRNRIEHRYEEALVVTSAGFAQSLVLNFEDELVAQFGPAYSIADQVHLPVSLSAYTREGMARLAAAQRSLPKKLQDFFVNFRSGLDGEVVNDRRFEFRIEIMQKAAPKTTADLAISFVHEDQLTPEELKAYEDLERTGRVILREKSRPVSNLGLLRPKPVSATVEAAIPFKFGYATHFPRAYAHYKVRPPNGAKGAAKHKTDERYCHYDEAHDDYVYTEAFVKLLVKDCKTADGFKRVTGVEPRPKRLPVTGVES